MATAVQAKTRESIHQLARRVFTEAKGDEDAARQRWLSKVRQDAELLNEALAYLSEIVVCAQVSQQRTTLLRAAHANDDRGTKDSGLAARGQSNLMAFALPRTHKPLAQATKAEVKEASLFYRELRAANGLRERWLGLIFRAMEDDKKTVRQQLSETDLRNMESRARREEESR